MATRTVIVLAALLIAVASCGGDDGDDSSSSGESSSDATAAVDSPDDTVEFVVPEVSDEDDVVTQLLARIFALPADFLTAEQRDCMSGELEGLFPDGVPEDVQLTEEISGALDAAAEACGVGL